MKLPEEEIPKEIAHQEKLIRIYLDSIRRLDEQIAMLGEAHAPVGHFIQKNDFAAKQHAALAQIVQLKRQLKVPAEQTAMQRAGVLRDSSGFDLAGADKAALISWLARCSVKKGRSSESYFQHLLDRSEFGDELKAPANLNWGGDAASNARQLVDWAIECGINPKDHNTALGSILLQLLPDGELGDQIFIAGLVHTYQLLGAQSEIDALRIRYQIPDRTTNFTRITSGPSAGPDVEWAKETSDLELQGWFIEEPQYVGVGLLMQAVERARSVCRIEVGSKIRGTGLLIHKDLLLTNYHVLGGDLGAELSVLTANAVKTRLRFGAFSTQTPGADGQVVYLDDSGPIVASDPVYDFVLLRIRELSGTTSNIKPFFDLGKYPVKTDPLYILQHPKGGPMMLSLSRNGVTWIDPGRVKVQYTTKVSAGSSGSPCFDADWKLIALHHAGAGAKGEGIVMQSILEKIGEHLA